MQFSTSDRNVAYKKHATYRKLYGEWSSENETLFRAENLVRLSGQTIVPLVIVFWKELMRPLVLPFFKT